MTRVVLKVRWHRLESMAVSESIQRHLMRLRSSGYRSPLGEVVGQNRTSMGGEVVAWHKVIMVTQHRR